jgi:ketosteroid isomerase-like protein
MASQQQDNVEMARERYEAFNDQQVEAVLAGFDDQIEWHAPEGAMFGGTYHGPEAVVENVFERVYAEIEDLELEVERFVDGGETVVALGRVHGRARDTGASLDIPFAHVIDMDGGKITRFQEYADTAQMNRDLGIEP